MNTRTVYLFLIVGLLCLPATLLAGANLTTNPGFETDADSNGVPDGWWSWASGGAEVAFVNNPSYARTGDDYAFLDSSAGGYCSSTPAMIPVVEGQVYTIGGYARDVVAGGSAYGASSEVLYYDSAGERNGDPYKHIIEVLIPNDSQYHFFSGETIPIPSGIAYITAGGWASAGSAYYYDDFYCGIGLPSSAEISNPDPFDTQTGVSLNPTLTWQVDGSYSSPTYDVYFGTNRTDVADGTGGTSKGSRSVNNYTPSILQVGTTYYWKIDVVDGGQTYSGYIWQFSTYIPEPDCLEELIADVNGDCVVDITDAQIMGQQWLDISCTPPNCADLNESTDQGITNSDLAILSSEWLLDGDSDVVINEFMASNTTTLVDEIGEYPDWIELKNISDVTVNLDGWYLTDDEGDTNKWEIPAVSIYPGQYLIIFASNKNLSDPAGTLHTNFTLSIEGGYLGLYRPDRTLEHEYVSYPVQAEDVSYGLAVLAAENIYTTGYFLTPTNGAANGVSDSNLGPYINDVAHSPLEPSSSDSLVVTATITQKIDPVNASSVTLRYRAMFGSETSVTMYDDGSHNDGAAGDNVYGATIPSGIASPGEMIRYYITADDDDTPTARTNRNPLFIDTDGMRQSPEYWGTVVNDPALTSSIAIYHWFVENVSATNTRGGTRASVYFNGEFYDNIFCRIRGGSITGGDIPNKSYKFEFNRGYYFRFSPDEKRVDEFNLSSTIPDKAYVRQILAFESFRDAGSYYCETFPMRTQQNDQFFSVQTFVEQVDTKYLERQGLDTEGALYKMYTEMDNISNIRKKTREYEGTSDLQALVNGLLLSGGALENYLFDNLNLPSVINYAAVHTIINNVDHGAKNYYAYRDTNGSGEWQYLSWDVDLSFGKMWTYENYLLDDNMVYGSTTPTLKNASRNNLLDAIYTNPRTEEMYFRRLRSLSDQLLQPPSTPYAQRKYEARVDELYTQMLPDATLHYFKWGNPWYSPHDPSYEDQSFSEAIAIMKAEFLDLQRDYYYNVRNVGNGGPFVNAQMTNPDINIGAIVFNPVSGNQDEEYIELTNTESEAVDISGWELTGGVTFTFEPGTVMPPGDTMYVSPDLAAFRARATSPTGNEGNFVRGNYKGHLSSWGETINLLDASDTLKDTVTYAGAPSDQQQYLRITEMMYHPAQGGSYNEEEYEYIELMNIGSSELDLANAKFTNGIAYTFPAGTPTTTTENLVVIEDSWRYEQTRTDLGTSWRPYVYDDSSWPQGNALLAYETSSLPAPINTTLDRGPGGDRTPTFYFRKHFNLNADPSVDTVTLEMNTIIDDGAVFYLNGVEVYRLGMHPTDPIYYSTLATRAPNEASYEGPFTIPIGALVQGDNVIAVEVHQGSANSSDVVFGLTLDAQVDSAGSPAATLAASELGLVVKNQAAFESRYGMGLNIIGQYTGSLSNGGEEIKLEDSTNSTILEFDYNDSWFDITDGDGFSLNIINVNDTNRDLWDDKDGWKPSTTAGGTPSAEDTGTINPGDIVINEVLAHSDVMYIYDWLELHNTTGAAINIGGWFLSDSAASNPDRMKYEISAGISIPANGYKVFYENLHFGNPVDPGSNQTFALSENGETVHLQSGLGGVLTGYYVERDFGASAPDIAFGRHYKASTDSYNFVAMSSATPEGVNAYPKVGPIVINEIMYHPAGNSDAEYVELLNTSGSSVTLYDSSTSEAWRFVDDAGDATPGLLFDFPTGGSAITMAPGEYLLLVKNEAIFRSEFTPQAGVEILEWTTGGLSNGGEQPQLSMPGDVNGSGERQYIRIDRVTYDDAAPWPTAPDGSGSSLSRVTSTNYGNDVANWQSAAPSPGRADF